jgi:cytochrome c5
LAATEAECQEYRTKRDGSHRSMMFTFTLAVEPPDTAAMALAGGGLLYRGICGHCHAYQALGIGTAADSSDKRSRPLIGEPEGTCVGLATG